jgi:hypothetical protein
MATTLAQLEADLPIHLDHLRELPFVRNIQLVWEPKLTPYKPDAVIKLKTPHRTFALALETKRTFLDKTLTNALIAEHTGLQRRHRLPLLLAARYIPRPTGERLIEAGVNFIDRVGNINLKLGDEYNVQRLGRRDTVPEPATRRAGPAFIQLLFVMLAEPEAVGWPIRKLADTAGIGKTVAATGRQRLIGLGILKRGVAGTYRIVEREKLVDAFVAGYNDVLRPRLLIGRFRAFEHDPERLLPNVAAATARLGIDWAATGAPAAYALNRFYRGEEVPLFLKRFTPELQRELRLVTDRNGPVVLLRAFGHQTAWRTVGNLAVAHPWLIYAELLREAAPRALEAAEQIRQKYLLV